MSNEQKRSLADRLSLLLSGDAVLLRTEFAKNTLREAIATLTPKTSESSHAPQSDLFAA